MTTGGSGTEPFRYLCEPLGCIMVSVHCSVHLRQCVKVILYIKLKKGTNNMYYAHKPTMHVPFIYLIKAYG